MEKYVFMLNVLSFFENIKCRNTTKVYNCKTAAAAAHATCTTQNMFCIIHSDTNTA